jgi:hypothetical protein
MSMAKEPSARIKPPAPIGTFSGPAPRGLASAVKVAAPAPSAADEWAEPETTQVDARIEDRSDWARPIDTGAVQHIEKMVEEVLGGDVQASVPSSPIEDHRGGDLDPPTPASRRTRRGRTVALALAGAVAVAAAAAWFLLQKDLLPVRF